MLRVTVHYTTSAPDFLEHLPEPRPLPTLRGVLMIRPDGFRLSPLAATDNRYMASGEVDPARALAEHEAVAQALTDAGVHVEVVAGDPAFPDACYPNNAIATLPGGTVIYGALKHPDRQGEPRRRVVREHLASLGYTTVLDWSDDPAVVCELTGSLVIDHARRIGYVGMTDRINRLGVDLIARHWDLDLLYEFPLTKWEYHTNVVLAILAGRACIVSPGAFANPLTAVTIATVYGERVLMISPTQHEQFAGNILSLGEDLVAMSETAARALGDEGLADLESWGFRPLIVPIPELEKGGGSMRCLLCELW